MEDARAVVLSLEREGKQREPPWLTGRQEPSALTAAGSPTTAGRGRGRRWCSSTATGWTAPCGRPSSLPWRGGRCSISTYGATGTPGPVPTSPSPRPPIETAIRRGVQILAIRIKTLIQRIEIKVPIDRSHISPGIVEKISTDEAVEFVSEVFSLRCRRK